MIIASGASNLSRRSARKTTIRKKKEKKKETRKKKYEKGEKKKGRDGGEPSISTDTGFHYTAVSLARGIAG